jgi:selT/selW/selH-like putative selenoprotein
MATGLAAELEAELDDVEIELIPSGGGVFEVVADGKLIHSKKATRRFPERGEIVAALRAR